MNWHSDVRDLLAEASAAKFLIAKDSVPRWTSCPSAAWLPVLRGVLCCQVICKCCSLARELVASAEFFSERRSISVIDIRCNKGYTSFKIFNEFAPEAGFTPQSLEQVSNQRFDNAVRVMYYCGASNVIITNHSASTHFESEPLYESLFEHHGATGVLHCCRNDLDTGSGCCSCQRTLTSLWMRQIP